MLRIEAEHWVAAVTPGDARRTAPICRWMARWSERRIREYCARKGWKVEPL